MKRVLLLWSLVWACAAQGAPNVAVGSKSFTESVILGELIVHLAHHTGAQAQHRRGLGGTRILWNALRRGELDIYPEYTGTLRHEILAGRNIAGREALHAALAAEGLAMTGPLGFNNTYALGMRRALAERLSIVRISDLTQHPQLAFGFSSEFMDRADGWPGLKNRYGLPQTHVRGLDHDLAYRGLQGDSLQVVDLYATDAEIRYYDLRVLEDDRGYFPAYQAIVLYRRDLADRAPKLVTALRALAGKIDAPQMVAMNARVKLKGESESRVAADYAATLGIRAQVREVSAWAQFWQHTREHFVLVGISLLAAIATALPLGVFAAHRPRWGQGILAAAGVIQTIPSLALLVFMIPLLGIGGPPAVAALFLYSLLPIIRNTCAGLTQIDPALRDSADALGLSPAAKLTKIELPLATPTILAGIKIAAVINVGTATLAALIGAGGYGQPIFTGIRLDDMGLILQGAVPAAGLALLVQGAFELAERWWVPPALRR